MKVGVIGFGRFGAHIARFLAQDFNLFVYDKIDYCDQIKNIGATPASFDEVCSCPFIIPFVPISEFRSLMESIKDKISPNATIIDVCSVKEQPVQAMKDILPDTVSILATHPMFGPDSAAQTLFGTKIVLCKVRIDDGIYSDIKSYLEGNGIKVIEVTPKDHDEQISMSLVLAHFIGNTLIDFGAKDLLIDTKGYRRLLKILQTCENDSWQLFEDMNKYNRFAKITRDHFINSINKVSAKIE